MVNAANSSLLGGGGVDGAIHKAGGPSILEACKGLGGCQTGEAKATTAGDLPCSKVIHTVGPIWQGGHKGEPELLASCYRNSLALADRLNLPHIAFSAISTGIYGYPLEEAAKAATESCKGYADTHAQSSNLRRVTLVTFDADAYHAYQNKLLEVFPEDSGI